jgi:single-stranded DNA-binding protein
MNDLNSLLVEGVIKQVDFEEKSARLVIENRRVFKNRDGALDTELCSFVVRIQGESLIESARKYANLGRKVRVVGRIYDDSDKEMRVIVIAEHIEFCPGFKAKGERGETPQGESGAIKN